MSIQIIASDKITSSLGKRIDWLIFSVSYEERSPVLWSAFKGFGLQLIGFYNGNHNYIQDITTQLNSSLPECQLIELNSDNPVKSFDVIRKVITDRVKPNIPLQVALDITCFTREAMAMILLSLHHLLPIGSTVTCLYTKAEQYPEDTEGPGWLSRGVASIRSVMGYRGSVRMMAETHLIVLPGFEFERTDGIIEALQPDRITIGYIDEKKSSRPLFASKTAKTVKKIIERYSNTTRNNMEFSADDPYFTCNKILECISEKDNTVIACLNNKVSMAGTCMAAIKKPMVQLIYAQPIAYNKDASGKPSKEILAFDFPVASGKDII